MVRVAGTIVLTVGLLGAGACAARVRLYDEPHHDYHRWDSHEEASFRLYLGERHMEYRDFHQLSPKDQNDYWAWRHDHPDRGRS